MNAPKPAAPPPSSATRRARRIATVVTMSAFVFVALWLMAFSVLTSLMVASGCCVVVTAAGSVSDVVEMMLDAIAAVIFGVLAVIGAIFAAIVGLFGF